MSQELSYLNPEQRESLEGLPFAVLVPGELPAGWAFEAIDFDEQEEGASFALRIVQGRKRCAFLTSNEGIGDAPPGVRQSAHQHPELGEIKVEHEEDGALLSDWLEVENGWCAIGGNDLEDADLDAIVAQLLVI